MNMDNVKLLNGNNLDLLKTLEDNSVDSVVTDPPYGLSFMNKKWDYDVPSVEFWKEVYRVLKPGGHVLSFGGTRTYHRMVVNMEDAGFEIRDQIMWIYGSGFPKSLNVGKAVDKLEGNEREVVGQKTGGAYSPGTNNLGINRASLLGEGDGRKTLPTRGDDFGKITKGQSPYEGFGTALKPANEPICLARKPLSEKSVAENVLKWGTGGINIDGCRIEGAYGEGENKVIEGKDAIMMDKYDDSRKSGAGMKNRIQVSNPEGRFPANIIFECICDEVIKGEKGEVKKSNRNRSSMKDNGYGFGENVESIDNYNDKGDIHTNPDCPCYQLDKQSGISKSISQNGYIRKGSYTFVSNYEKEETLCPRYGDKGGASRFFYVAKVSKKERNMGLDGFEEKGNKFGNQKNGNDIGNGSVNDRFTTQPKKNNHPTVKPINLLTYLCRLITPPNGVILDPFMGSGSTGISAKLEGFGFIGMEMDEDYFKIASARIENLDKYKDLIKK